MLRSGIERWLQDLRPYRRVALDTDVVVYALDNVLPYQELARHLLRLMERGFMVGTVSTVVVAEVLVKPLRERDELALEKAELFFRYAPNLIVRSFDRTIARRAALVRARSHLPVPDAIIVATALEERFDVLIGNDASMASIPSEYISCAWRTTSHSEEYDA